MPGDPIGTLIASIIGGSEGSSGGGGGEIYKLLYDNWIIKFGLNKPLHEQYIIFIVNIATLSFGPSIIYYPRQSLDVVLWALPWSLGLLVPAIIFGWLIGNYVGTVAAYKKGIYDKLVYPFFLSIATTPYYWFALILVTLFSGVFPIFPPGGAYDVTLMPGWNIPFIIDFLRHYTLPFLSLLIPYIGKTAVGMRAMVLYEIGSDYMDYSQSLGLPRRTLQKYAYRNAILPALTSLPMHFGAAFTGQVISEVVFGYPGIGFVIYSAILNLDYNVIQCAFVLVIFIILSGNFIVDVIYTYVDPRILIAYKNE